MVSLYTILETRLSLLKRLFIIHCAKHVTCKSLGYAGGMQVSRVSPEFQQTRTYSFVLDKAVFIFYYFEV